MELGREMETKLEQSKKAPPSIEVMELGRTIEVKP